MSDAIQRVRDFMKVWDQCSEQKMIASTGAATVLWADDLRALCTQSAATSARPATMPRTFEYLLNAMEGAAQSENPFERGYREKRRAVFQYVEDLWSDYLRRHNDACDLAMEKRSATAATKLFVVIGGWDYEGYSEPTGIYSTKEQADAAKQHAKEEHNYDSLSIMEYDLNVGELEQAKVASTDSSSKEAT